MNMNAMLMAAMIAACVVLASGADTVNVGGIDVVSDAAEFTQISNDVCELYDDMTDKPIDFDKTEAAYTEERTIDGYNYSLQELAQEGVAAFDQDQGKYWDTFAAYYDDEEWMDTFIESAISGEASTDPESVRKVYVQKEVRDSVMISMMLSFLDDAHSELENASGASIDDVKQNARYDLDAAWSVYYGSNEDTESGLNTSFKCSPWGTAERKADDFGANDDVNQAIMTDIKAGQEVIEGIESEDDLAQAADDLEKLIDEIVQEVIITYLRSVVRYAYRMDGGAALELAAHEFDDLEDLKGDGLSYVQKAQGEGYVFGRVVLPLVAETNPDEAQYLEDVYSEIPLTEEELLTTYERVTPGVLEAVGGVLETLGISEETFGNYDSDRETTD